MRVSVLFILVVVGTCSAIVPSVTVAFHVSIQVANVFKPLIAGNVFAHEQLTGMSDLVLDKPALKRK